jgi:mannose-6-phosphate isomerase
VLRLDNPVRHYAWGSTSFIPDLLGRSADERPWAELWMGAHESAPSLVEQGNAQVRLDTLVERDPEGILGASTVRRYGPRLPFLFKVLAAEQPLSIQAHPDQAQARAGFERENVSGIPVDAPHRNYRDDNHKPELIVALTPFVALEGFRAPEVIAAELDSLRLAKLDSSNDSIDLIDLIDALRGEDGLRRFFETVMSPRGARVLEPIVAALADRHDARATWVRELAARHPGDVGALAPLYLELVELAPGQGLFLPARELHAYLHGAGLELMASSDNVLRGGLTPKHVDVPELLATLRFEPGKAHVIDPPAGYPVVEYPTPADEFALSRLELTGHMILPARKTPAIVLCTEGQLHARAARHTLALARGQSALLPAGTPELELEPGDQATLWLAEVPATRSRAAS